MNNRTDNKMLKLICLIVSVALLLGTAPMAFAEDVADIVTYSWKWSKEQGTDGWYFCSFVNGEASELQWNSERSFWYDGNSASIRSNGSMLPTVGSDIGMVFKAPSKGMLRIKGNENLYYPWGEAYAGSDGVNVTIMKGSDVLWTQYMKYGDKPSYEVFTSVREGEEIKFIMNANKSSGYDDVVWKPSVSYTTAEYVEEEEKDYTYYEKKNGELTKLEFNSSTGKYVASDNVAYISPYEFMLTDNNTFVKRYVVAEDGRCRVAGRIASDDNRGSGCLITVYKNSDEVWRQFIPENESGNFDFRMMVNAKDIIDVEVENYLFEGYGYYEWNCEITHIPGTVPEAKISTGLGYNYITLQEDNLSELIGTAQNSNSSVYLRRNDVKFPMSFDSSKSKWSNDQDATAGISGDIVTVSQNDVVVDVNVQNTGILRVWGNLTLASGTSDGVLSKIYLNDKLLWSNRVGGERSVRWDEPFDISFFNNEVNAVANVSRGDVLSFTFNCWRESSNDRLNIGDVKLTYLKGSPLSKTTKWKINRSIAVDTADSCVYINGSRAEAGILLEDGTTYILKNDISKLFGEGCGSSENEIDIGGNVYVPLRETAVLNGNTVWWTADRLVLMNKELPIFFGYSDLTEIDVALKEGDLFE